MSLARAHSSLIHATGEAFNLAMEEVAAATAVALDADKLVFLAEVPGVHGDDGCIQTEILEARARALLARDDLALPLHIYLSAALKACEGGVARSHIVPFAVDGSVLEGRPLHRLNFNAAAKSSSKRP